MNWPVVKLGEISRPKQWPTLAKKGMTGAGYQVYGANGPIGFTDQYTHAEGLCCTKPSLSGLPLSPDGFIPRPL